MDKDTVVKVDNLSKKFCRSLKRSMFYGSLDMVRDMIGVPHNRSHIRTGEFWALKDISFELKKGEVFGVIGQNGSGKTTLLRLINGIFPPDEGKISVRGRIGALIAVGSGFHPHMTGRENIYLSGTILGMSRREIDERFQEIIGFADIGEFIDAPVSTYSSGMTVRLGFSIAIHSRSEILLADEVLAVGDLSFVLKCYRKIAEYREDGGSIILVSHSVQLVRNTCQQVMWIEKGEITMKDDVQAVCDRYEQEMFNKDAVQETGQIIRHDENFTVERIEFLNEKGERGEIVSGKRFTARIFYRTRRAIKSPILVVSIFNPENIMVISNYTNNDGFEIAELDGTGYVDFTIDSLNLKPSAYRFSLSIHEDGDLHKVVVWYEKSHVFTVVTSSILSYGLINPYPKWALVRQKTEGDSR